jgi:hypothetical protein
MSGRLSYHLIRGRRGLVAIGLLPLLALGPAPAAESEAAASPADVLQFFDGSTLRGKLEAIEPEEGLVWRHPDAKKPIRFRPANIASVTLPNAQPLALEPGPASRLEFINGDEIYGKVTGLDQNDVTFKTPFGGELQAKRNSVSAIAFSQKGFSVIYEGPTGLDGWVHGQGQRRWQYKDGALVTNGPGILGRDFKFTGSCLFAFDLSWNGHFSMMMNLFTDTVDRFDYHSSSYLFSLGLGYINAQRMQRGAGSFLLGQNQLPNMHQKNKMRLEIRANKEEGTLALFVDDQLLSRWIDPAGFSGSGSGIVFATHMDGPTIKISNIRFADWDGYSEPLDERSETEKEDWIYLVNRDQVSGKAMAFEDDLLTFETGHGLLSVPVQRITRLTFAYNPEEDSAPQSSDVRAFFSGGGNLVFSLEQWNGNQLTGASPNLGRVELSTGSVRQIQLNLDRSISRSEDPDLFGNDEWELDE